MLKVILIAFTLIPAIWSISGAQDWAAAEKAITRLTPENYPQLPKEVRKNLLKRGCTVPQCFDTKQPHNVIKGSFLRKGREDWAVLCSSGGVSSILIFPGGSAKKVVSTGAMADINFLQGMGGDTH